MSQSSSRIAAARQGASPRARGAKRPASDAAVQGLLQRLTRLKPGPHRVVTLHLKVEPRDRARGKYLIKLKNRVTATAAQLDRLGLPRPVREQVERDLARIVEHLRAPSNLPSTHGIAVFACEALGLFEAQPLPFVHRSRLAVDATPLVRELAAVEDEFGRLVTVVLDRHRARVFEVTAFGCVEREGVASPATRGGRFRGDQDSPGWGEHSYNNRIREEKQRHFAAIADLLFELDRREPVHGLVLAGPGGEAAAVEPFLHQYLAGRLLGFAKLNPKDVTPAVVRDATLAVREQAERLEERQLAEELDEAWGAGWARNGLSVTLKALARGQVRTLLVDADVAQPGFRVRETGRLVEFEREGRADGTVEPVLDVVDDAIEEALRQRVDVRVLFDDDARAKVEGLAALLRFK